MKYVKNNGRYAKAFTIKRGNAEVKIEFDRLRIYFDTGNIATTGVTEVDDKDYAELEKFPQFKKLFETKEFELTDQPSTLTTEAQIAQLKAENAKLKAANKKEDNKKAEKELKEKEEQLKNKEEEITSLKAKLEALVKTSKKASDDTEGF